MIQVKLIKIKIKFRKNIKQKKKNQRVVLVKIVSAIKNIVNALFKENNVHLSVNVRNAPILLLKVKNKIINYKLQ